MGPEDKKSQKDKSRIPLLAVGMKISELTQEYSKEERIKARAITGIMVPNMENLLTNIATFNRTDLSIRMIP